MKTILLVTNSFPFGLGEASFIRPEIRALSKQFHIYIVSRNVTEAQTTQLPENVTVVRYNPRAKYHVGILLWKALCSKDFRREMLSLLRSGTLRGYKIQKALRYCMRSMHFARFLEEIRATLPESVLLYTYWNDFSVYSLSMIKRPKDKLVSRLHRADIYLTASNRYYFPLKVVSNVKTDLLAFISKQGMQYFQETFCDTIPAQVFYLGVKPQKNQAPFSEKDSLNILSFSYLSPVKRVSRIVECLGQVNDISVHWVHIGDGTEREKVTAEAQKHLAGKENITYTFKGAMENEDALRYISENEFDFLLNVSASEGIPVTMMECMSFGIPVVATDVGGVSELVEDGQNGYLLSEDFSFEAFHQTLKAYQTLSYAQKCILRKNALQTWQNKFNEEANMCRFSEALQNL